MRKWLLMLLLFIASCDNMISSTTPSKTIPRREAFEVSDKCPHLCWLGINPEVTSDDDAVSILMATSQINQEKLFQRSEAELRTIWFTDNTDKYYSRVRLVFSGNIVKSIHFNLLTPFTVSDFISMLGEPDTIIIELDKTIDGGDIVNYAVYFSSQHVSLSVYPGRWDGPHPDDYVDTLTLNAEFTYPDFFIEGKIQSWLGYGRLQDYLPGQELPTGPDGTSQP